MPRGLLFLVVLSVLLLALARALYASAPRGHVRQGAGPLSIPCGDPARPVALPGPPLLVRFPRSRARGVAVRQASALPRALLNIGIAASPTLPPWQRPSLARGAALRSSRDCIP